MDKMTTGFIHHRTVEDAATFSEVVRQCHALNGSCEAPMVVAAAPTSIDVMGGIAEPAGATTLRYAGGPGVTVCVQQRGDQQLAISHVDTRNPERRRVLECPLDALPVDPSRNGASLVTPRTDAHEARWAAPILQLLATLAEHVPAAGFRSGWTIVVQSVHPPTSNGNGLEETVSAAARALNEGASAGLDTPEIVELCRQAIERCHRFPVGLSSPFCCWAGKPHRFVVRACSNPDQCDNVEIPRGCACLSVVSDAMEPDALERCRHAWLSAAIGQRMIGQLLRRPDGAMADWDGRLATVGSKRYVERVRDRLPIRMRGCDVLARFGNLNSTWGVIDVDSTYKIRSRTEHHIYEGDRCDKFAELLQRGVLEGNLKHTIDAGELMYASHWSYGQRCGLGNVVADTLVAKLRSRGPRDGIFGARINGWGSAGLVTVLMGDDDRSRTALDQCMAEVSQAHGATFTVYDRPQVGSLEVVGNIQG